MGQMIAPGNQQKTCVTQNWSEPSIRPIPGNQALEHSRVALGDRVVLESWGFEKQGG